MLTKSAKIRMILIATFSPLLCCILAIGVFVITQLHGISFQGRIAIGGIVGPDNAGIFLYDRLFHTLKRITSEKTSAYSPTWSPEGERIAFLTSEKNLTHLQIVVYNIRNGLTEAIIEENVDGYLISPVTSLAWSPDGNQLLFDAVSDGCHSLFLYQFYKKETHPIDIPFCQSKSGDSVYRLDLSWYPGNSPLVGVSENDIRHSWDDIYILDHSLTKLTWVTQGSYPVWRPGTEDFSYICRKTQYTNSMCLYSMETGLSKKIVTDYGHNEYSWSPDGQSILFVDTGLGENHQTILTLVDIESGKRYHLQYLLYIIQIDKFSWHAYPWFEGKAIWSSR